MTLSSPQLKTTYLLEMRSPEAFRPKLDRPAELEIRRVEIACPELNWFLFQLVGVDYRWGGRDSWDREAWTRYADRAELETWVAYVAGTPAGYFELERQSDGSVRVQCFGLRRPFLGQGLGGPLLTACVRRAWEMDATKVWLKTCSHDHPHALQNYLDRGFQIAEQTAGPANPAWRSALF